MQYCRVLHVTPHLGGGVGRVVLNYLKTENNNQRYAHSVFSLDTVKQSTVDELQALEVGIDYNCQTEYSALMSAIAEADIVLLHWWNHPLLFHLLVTAELPACRLVIWSHISGSTSPNVFTSAILDYPDEFRFTTPVSFDYADVTKGAPCYDVIWSTAGLDYVEEKPKTLGESEDQFVVGYLGTVDAAKLHPEVLQMCRDSEIPGVKFVFCGGAQHEQYKAQAREMDIAHKVEFVGEVAEINQYLHKFDVFGYPLVSSHYGTCDQVLAEAMAAGIVPVVFNNAMESMMVEHRVSGLVAKDKEEYLQYLVILHQDKKLRQELASSACKKARARFSATQMADQWLSVFNDLILRNKSTKRWSSPAATANNTTAFQVFLESLDPFHKQVFQCWALDKSGLEPREAVLELARQNNWRSLSKGTVHQYASFFPQDRELQELSRLMQSG